MDEEAKGAKDAGEATPQAKKGSKGPQKGSGKGKGPSGPSTKGKSKGKEAPSVPSWQKPEISSEWQVERMVNWQPIRQTSRLEGSVWQQVHDSLDGGAAKLPEEILGRFMRKVSEVPQKRASDVGQKKTTTKRLLSAKQALVADIHHALLTRKGIRTVNDLTWILGPVKDECSEDALSEDLLEALQGLLGAAAGEERSLTAAGQALKDGAPSELFLRQLLEREPLQELQIRVQLNLDMAHFDPRVRDLESGLDLALTAAWTIIDSKAMPILLEGILLLGNSVNAASKNLGGAVGVTLESLTKLAHTRCLPAKQAAGSKRKSSRVESALEVLALHLDQANEGFICNLISDLEACHFAKDFDHQMMASFVQDLAVQVGQVGKHLAKHPTAEAPCIRPQRLQEFVTEADVRVQHLQKCLEEIDEATESLRQWFAEPPSSSLHDMLKALAALRQLLPAPKPSETLSPAPDYRLSTTRKRRLEEKKKAREQRKAQEDANTAVTMEIPSEGQAQGEPEEPEVPKNDAGDQAREMPKGEAEDAKEAAEGSLLPIPNSIQSEACQVEPPSGVLAQILSFSKGTIWISWLFDWSDVRRGFASGADHMCAFEVVHFGESEELNSRPSSRWRCPTAPLKMDVPLGCHYVFGVRAILLKGDQLHDSEMLWASPISSPVMLDLRYSTSSIGNVSTSLPVGSVGSRLISPPMEEKSPQGTPRRGRVASSMGDFISSLQSGGSPTTRRLSLRPPSGRSGTPKEEDEASGKSTLESCQASLEKGSFVEMEVEKSQHQELTLPVGRGADAVDESQSPSSVPIPSKQSDESCSAETPLSVGDLDEFDDESLLRLVQAFTYLETRRSRTTEAGVCGTPSSSDAKDAPEPPKAQEVDVAKTLPAKEPAAEVKPSQAHKAAFRVPRATSVFDDLGTLESMADVLSNVEAVNRDTNLESPSSGCQLEAQGTSEILDGAEVLAEIERKFVQQRKTCEACNGTGYVGLFGATGFGFFQTKCSSCSK